MSSPKRWNDASFPEIDFADILDSEEIGIVNDAGSQKVYKKGTLIADLATLYQAVGTALLAAQNLSDLDDVPTARTNLDVYSEAEVDSAIDTDIATHSADATSVHGITDTAQLATLNTTQTVSGIKTFAQNPKIIKSNAGFIMQDPAGSITDEILYYFVSSTGYFQLRNNTLLRNCVRLSAISPSDSLILDSSGRLGINEVNPTEKLHVVGNFLLSGVLYLGTYTVSTLPTATVRGFIYVSDETGGATTAFSNGTNWLRSQDRAIVA